MTIAEDAPAKLNLALHVRSREADGYHRLETLFAFVRDGDRVTLAPAETDMFRLTGPFGHALSGEGDNLVTRARDAFRARFGVEGRRFAIVLDKHLPVASGIGGGSADAAATLRAMARAHGVATDDPGLVAVARTLGADVPACLLGRTARGMGRGDMLTPVAGIAGTPCLLVNPGVALSTARVFGGWDGVDRGAMPDGDARRVCLSGRNDLEPPARALAPEVGEALALLGTLAGAWLVRMSGSGATCFALYDDAGDRGRAAAAIRAAHPDWWCLETALT